MRDDENQALGYVAPLAEEKDMVSQTKEQLLAMMDTAMGGRAAEEVFYGYFYYVLLNVVLRM